MSEGELDAASPSRPVWSSQRAYILATIAGVIGLGNLWRFPYMVGLNGGGTFILAYVICILVLAVPLAALESSAGKMANRGVVGTFRAINPRWGVWLGWFVVAMTVAIMSTYLVVTGWTLGYFVDALRNDIKEFAEFNTKFTSLRLFLIVCIFLVFVMRHGIGGIEKLGRFLLPILIVIVGGLAILAQVNLPGTGAANSFYFGFSFEALASATLWRMAAGQAFYSVAIGQGILIAYGSYIPKKTNVVNSTMVICTTNAVVSFVAGLMIFPIVFTFNIPPDSGSGLAFTAMPAALNQIPGQGAHLVGIAYFGLLFLAAFTSCISGLEAIVTPLQGELHLTRLKAVLVTLLVVGGLGVPSALSFTDVRLTLGGIPFLDFMDRLTGSGVVLLTGFAGAASIAWFLPRSQLLAAINGGRLGDFIITYGRYLPIAALIVALLTTIF